jgi:hypothetical protein
MRRRRRRRRRLGCVTDPLWKILVDDTVKDEEKK